MSESNITIIKTLEDAISWIEDTVDEITITKLEDGAYMIVDEWREEE